jgi:hypothetical protein
MSLRSMRKQRGWRRQACTRRERIGADLVSRARSKIITQSSIQDHHGAGTPICFRLLTACPQVPMGIAKLHSFRTIYM